MSKVHENVGRRIKEKRLALGVTQEELGQILGCTQQMIQNYESFYCEMPLMMLKDMALLCKVTVDWFFLDEYSILVYYTELNNQRS